MNVPSEAVEAVARRLWATGDPSMMDEWDAGLVQADAKQEYMEQAHELLEAALPHLKASDRSAE